MVSIMDVVKRCSVQLFGHACRMDDQRLIKLVMPWWSL